MDADLPRLLDLAGVGDLECNALRDLDYHRARVVLCILHR